MICNQPVVGSSPTVGSLIFRELRDLHGHFDSKEVQPVFAHRSFPRIRLVCAEGQSRETILVEEVGPRADFGPGVADGQRAWEHLGWTPGRCLHR